jgi:hypothetical protein
MSPTIVTTHPNKKSPFVRFFSTDAAIPPPPASRPQVEPAQHLDQLGIVQLNAFFTLGGRQELKRASLQPLVPNAESIPIPKQDLEPIALAIQEQEQVA